MDIVGKRFEEGEYFLPELVLAGEMLENIGAIAKPLIKQTGDGPAKKLGKILIGTVQGDLHDIGKNIVTFMLDINGFDVKDIGVDVPVKTFIEEINAYQPDVVGLSGFLTLAFELHERDHRGLREGGHAGEVQDHDRRRADRRDRAQLHGRGCLRRERG